jgi:glycosyltransferase involved in cell wall biosynthesis
MSSGYRKKRVLLVNLGAMFGGAEVYVEELVQLLGDQTDCYVLCSNSELQRRLSKLKVRCIRFPAATGASKAVQMIAAMAALPYFIIRHRIHTVQINGYSEILLIPIARLLGKTGVATRHLTFDIEVKHWRKAPSRYLARFLYRHFARFANTVICVSKSVGREVSPLVPPGRVTVIQNWVASVPPMRIKPVIRDSAVTVLFVGRMVELKGLQVLIDALREIAAMPDGKRMKLVAVGDGEYRAELESRAAGLDATFVGFESDLTAYYENADIFVSPSFGPEGSSLAALDAMAYCVPCILSDIPAYSEIANGGEAAMLFRRGDSQELSACMRALVNSDERRRNYVQIAYDLILRNHIREVAIRNYLTVLGIQPDRAFAQRQIQDAPVHETEA